MRVAHVVDVFVHVHTVRGATVCPDGTPAVDHPYMKCAVSEASAPALASASAPASASASVPASASSSTGVMAQHLIRLHHYPLQSLDFFMQVWYVYICNRTNVGTKYACM